MMPRAVVEQRDQMGFVGLGREIASDDPASASAGPSSLNDLAIVSMAGDGKITGQRLEGFLSLRVFGDDTTVGKPNPRPLRMALDLAGVGQPETAFYVGDTLDDMRMSAAAGVRGIGVVSAMANANDLLAAGAIETAGSVVEWAHRSLADSGMGTGPDRL